MQILVTGDGSHTLLHPQLQEIYHSRYGAIAESRHVFIRKGLEYAAGVHTSRPLTVLEVGFGTGLNALLSMLYAEEHGIPLCYHALEPYPLSIDLVKQLNYTEMLGYEYCYGPYHTLHLCIWEEQCPVTSLFTFIKYQKSVAACTLPADFFAVVYYDAFAPERQPDMWTTEVFRKIHLWLKPGGVMVTYCSKSMVQRNLREAGFKVEKLPGPPGKREMLRAHKL
ncbi:MAG: tRNA (5-methylaminomethyl-2-thiouridine)(34)-methyltransferase MnmD [Chitinophagales bacterium]|nr:tRNA (5-methylaminomethyl-2-thiouridine)(34)-methyltransferase MnmD [Chitinophagales bacterium]MDW8418138.1 tRNA (5-methylaminomethyl-2-thiouridine)(34)-methyltransferase MnmD [Chitinophagales bacterium]